MKRVSLLVSLMLVASIVLAACGGAGGGGSPSATAKSWIEALTKFDFAAVKNLTCESQRAAIDSIQSSLESSTGGVDLSELLAQMKFDLSGLTFAESNVSGNAATVTVSGKMKVTVFGIDQEQDFDSQAVEMVNESGWKVCSNELTGLLGGP